MERFSRRFTIRWADCDVNGHLRNTCYSEYAIEVRMALLSSHGFGLPEFRKHGLGPVLLREEIDYLRECHMGEEVEMDVALVGRSEDDARFKIAHELRKPGGKTAARVVIHGGWLDLATRKLRPPPPEVLAIWSQVARPGELELLPPLGK